MFGKKMCYYNQKIISPEKKSFTGKTVELSNTSRLD